MPGKEIDSKGLKGREPKETGTSSDGKREVDGRSEHMRHSHHEMGSYKDGTHFHDHHRGKA